MHLLEHAEAINLQRDLVLSNMLCNSNRKVWERSQEVLAVLLRRRLQADAITFSALTSAQGFLHQWRHSLMTYAHMRQCAMPADMYIVAACLDSMAKRFAWEAASALLVSQTQATCNDSAYLAAIEGLSKASEWSLSTQQLEELECKGIENNILMHSAVAAGSLLNVVFVPSLQSTSVRNSHRHEYTFFGLLMKKSIKLIAADHNDFIFVLLCA